MDADIGEREFQKRKAAVLEECKLAPQVFEGVAPRLEQFMRPFVAQLARREQVDHALTLVRGLLSDLEDKNVESIAYRFNQGRMPLQWFIGVSKWNDQPLRAELTRQVGRELGDPDGVLVFDPSAFPKSGRESVGVARQWCGRLGKVENCQVAVYLGYVSPHEHVLVDTRLYLPQEWTKDKARMKKAGVPQGTKHRTRHELALEMLDQHGALLPHRWIAGDDEMGRPYWFRRDLRQRGEQYLLAVPSNTLIRDLEVEPPAGCGQGRPPARPWVRADRWLAAQPASAWTTLDVRDGAKGPLIVECLKRRVAARTDEHQQAPDEILVAIRYKDRDNERVVKTDYYLSNGSAETPLLEFARVAKAEHRIEECIQRGKSEAGLGDYEVRNWTGWQHHQTLSLIATWFLVSETRRGKKIHPRDYAPADPAGRRANPPPRVPMRFAIAYRVRTASPTRTKRTGTPLPLEAMQTPSTT
jgi:SRSO17 transposase